MIARVHDHLNRLHSRLRDSRLAMFGLNRLPRVYELAFGWMAEPLYQQVASDAAQARGLAPGDIVLDIGTGPGRVPRLLHRLRRDLEVEGLDVSEAMIEGARATADREEPVPSGGGALRYTVADVAVLPYPDRSVALIVSSLSLHHWPDPEAGIAEVRRVLRPGGTAWLYDVKPQLATTLRHLETLGAQARVAPLTPRSATGWSLRDHLLRRWVARLELT